VLQWTSASERRFIRLGGLHGTRVLVAHADQGARGEIRAVLEPLGCVVTEAGSPAEVLDVARRRRPRVLLLDATLERDADSSLVGELKSDPDLFAIAIVLVGAGGDASDALGAMEHGAYDVLPFATDAFQLAARVRAARRGSDMHELLLTRERELERLAYYDELTGLPNRRSVMRQLEALLSRARRHGHTLAVLMIDADHFKTLNDRHGHAAGDVALRALADRLGERLRAEDVVGRFGGEEFVIGLPDADAAGAAAVAEDVRAAVAEHQVTIDGHALTLTVSVGWAPWRDESLEQLLALADDAMYQAKAAGRNCVRSTRSDGLTGLRADTAA
jgi:two-component system cell cycle response regulator